LQMACETSGYSTGEATSPGHQTEWVPPPQRIRVEEKSINRSARDVPLMNFDRIWLVFAAISNKSDSVGDCFHSIYGFCPIDTEQDLDGEITQSSRISWDPKG
jgi:hypothetical protein